MLFAPHMLTSLLPRCLLGALLVGLLALPGSEGWAGFVAEGDQLASEHRLLSALDRYGDAASFPFGGKVAHVRLGGVYLRRDQPGEAVQAFREAEGLGSAGRETLLGLAEALERAGNARSGLETLRKEMDRHPADGEAWGLLVERAARSGARPEEIRRLLGDIPKPVGQRVDYLSAACLLEPGSPEALSALRRAASGPDRKLADVALELLGADEQSGNASASKAVGLLLGQGLIGPALDRLDRSAIATEADGWALRAYALMLLKDSEGAERAARRSLELTPQGSLAGFVLGSILRGRGDAEGAVRGLRDVALRDPANPAVYLELANAIVDLGDYGDAEQFLSQATELVPEDGQLRLAVARFYVDRQYRVELALPQAEAAVRLSDRSAAALGTLGWALQLVGRAEDALDPLREAVSKDPESPPLRYRLGAVYERLGDKERAREQYLMVGELDGSGEEWKRARAALEGL